MEEANPVIKRIEKDIRMFNDNIGAARPEGKMQERVIELSKMYAKDAKSYLDKGDLFTAFSCISYAHGLLDAIREINPQQ
ncbi:MAG: DUF357 domain-containing protein [Candidatus Micrarchaeota archaeon]|nr:DUF357 domain-containing protein [Candidatus Micrarchaeota archaeon]